MLLLTVIKSQQRFPTRSLLFPILCWRKSIKRNAEWTIEENVFLKGERPIFTYLQLNREFNTVASCIYNPFLRLSSPRVLKLLMGEMLQDACSYLRGPWKEHNRGRIQHLTEIHHGIVKGKSRVITSSPQCT
jgi:hypothetical protein